MPAKVGLAGVSVSNSRDVVQTDADGRYSLPVDDDCIVFVVKPTGYRTIMDKDHLSRFYYIHKPQVLRKILIFPVWNQRVIAEADQFSAAAGQRN